MKNYFFLLVAFCISFNCIAQKSRSDLPTLNEVLNKIGNSYIAALQQLQSKKIVIAEAKVTFSVSQTRSADGSIKILIFKINRKREKEKETTVTYTFLPAKVPESLKAEDDFSKLIVQAANEFLNANPPAGLQADNFEIELAFAVSKTTGGGLEFTVFSSDAGVGKEWNKKATHKISITFKKP